MKKAINVITPLHYGGPWFQGKMLAERIDRDYLFRAHHSHTLRELLSSPFVQNKYDLIYSFIPINYRFWRKPLILKVCGNFLVEKSVFARMYKTSVRMADLIIVPSQFLKHILGLDRKAVVIQDALDVNRYMPVEFYREKNINIVTVSKFVFLKKACGILAIFKMLNKLPTSVKLDINYTVVGGGKFLNDIQRQIGPTLINYRFVGWQDNPRQYLSNAGIFLYYSMHDNMPNVVLEAMAMGLPVITNKIGAVEEIIDHGQDGFIASNDDEFYYYLLQLITDIELQKKIGRQARKKIERVFNWDVVICRYLDIFRKMVCL